MSETTGNTNVLTVPFKGKSFVAVTADHAHLHKCEIDVTGMPSSGRFIVQFKPGKLTVDENGKQHLEEVPGSGFKVKGSYKALKGKKAKQAEDAGEDVTASHATANVSDDDGEVHFKELPSGEGVTPCIIISARPILVPLPFKIALAVLVLAAVGAVGAFTFLNSQWLDPNAQKGYYEGKTDEEIQEDLKQYVDEHSMQISVSPFVQISPGSTQASGLNVENIENNHCAQKFTISLQDTGEVLYESGAIYPGEYVADIELSRPLDEGVYAANVVFQGYEEGMTLFSDGQLFTHAEFGSPVTGVILLIVTDDDEVARATAAYYLYGNS
ncbi:MAG: hypothetical protein K6F70_03940 [Eggerthellaceae bacterium]|nr:hypothetical protein [Eggerthellaceae bacterium]